MNDLIYGFIFFIGLLNVRPAQAQPSLRIGDTTQLHLITFHNGNRLYGHLLAIDDNLLSFRFRDNELDFETRDVDQIYVITEKGLTPVFRTVEATGIQRFILSETAFGLPKAEGEYKTEYGLLHTVDVGLTDQLSLGGGLLLPIGLVGRIKLTGKLAEQFRIGVGNMFLLSFIGESTVLAYPYGNFTLGLPEKFVSFSLGSFVNFSSPSEWVGLASVGGNLRIREKWQLRTDNYILFTGDGAAFIPNFGAVWARRKNRIEFGLGSVIEPSFLGLIPFPYLAYARRF